MSSSEPTSSSPESPESPESPQPRSMADDGQLFSRVQLTQRQGVYFITFPSGKADGQAVRELYETSAQITDHYNIRVVLDLAGTSYVPSGMMGMLITVKKKISSVGGQFHVVVADPMILTSFHAMKLERILQLCDSVEDALARFKH